MNGCSLRRNILLALLFATAFAIAGACGGGGGGSDDGGWNSDDEPNACRTDCRAPFCGDGVLDDGEACDDGELRPPLPHADHFNGLDGGARGLGEDGRNFRDRTRGPIGWSALGIGPPGVAEGESGRRYLRLVR